MAGTHFNRFGSRAVLICALMVALAAPATAQLPPPAQLADKDIVEAYHYMLGRWLVLRQQALDFKDGMKWNQIVHREPGSVAGANPNLDVAYSEAWVAVDDTTCTLIEIPPIAGRYYTVQALNGWGETTANINERTYPKTPAGRFALCLKDSKFKFPPLRRGEQPIKRVELPSKQSRLLIRIELGSNPAEAVALQKRITMRSTGTPVIDKTPVEMDFPNDKLPGVEGFDKTEEILTSEPDINKGMVFVQTQVRAVAKAAADQSQRPRIDDVIRKRAIPQFMRSFDRMGTTKNGWNRPNVIGNYSSDYLTRSMVNLAGIWANSNREVVYFKSNVDSRGAKLDGNTAYAMTFQPGLFPSDEVKYFWSVIAVDPVKFQVIDNPLKRYLLNRELGVQPNPDGTLTLVFANRQPDGVPQQNWLPTPAGQNYQLTFRFYGPSKTVISGTYFPPPLVRR